MFPWFSQVARLVQIILVPTIKYYTLLHLHRRLIFDLIRLSNCDGITPGDNETNIRVRSFGQYFVNYTATSNWRRLCAVWFTLELKKQQQQQQIYNSYTRKSRFVFETIIKYYVLTVNTRCPLLSYTYVPTAGKRESPTFIGSFSAHFIHSRAFHWIRPPGLIAAYFASIRIPARPLPLSTPSCRTATAPTMPTGEPWL